MNARIVFDTLRRSSGLSRADLSRRTGISQPTVARTVDELLASGLIEQVGTARGAGRPSTTFQIGRCGVQVLGATIDVRHSSVLSAGLDGQVDLKRIVEFETPDTYDALIDMIVERSKRLLNAVAKANRGRVVKVLGMGVSVPGAVDYPQQRIVVSPNLHMTDGRQPGVDLSKRLGFPVRIFHESAAGALATEAWGEARGMRNFVAMGVHEGFGLRAVMDGRIAYGQSGMAGEVGHITVDIDGERCGCGNRGCLETVATDTSLARALSRRVGKPLAIEDVVRLSREGSLDPRPELDRTIEYLAVGVAAAINIYNPEAVIVGARMFDALPGTFEKMREIASRRALSALVQNCQIIRGGHEGIRLGAIASIIQHLIENLGPSVG